jgi:DNA gyrase inhibitor GyrI/AraC-like DNA-binding protein
MDFVERNLEKELPLGLLSKVACFSPFHFHRIFSVITGETLNAFINRKRIEKVAATLLVGTKMPLTDLALSYGFNSGSSFSRAFKKYYGISASEFKEHGKEQFSKISKEDSKNGKEIITFEKYICNISNIKKWIQMNAKFEVKEMPALNLARISHLGDYEGIVGAYDKLFKWAGAKGLMNHPDFKAVTLYHDNPSVTEVSKIRQSACITVDDTVKGEGEVGIINTQKAKYAVGSFEIKVTEFENAWTSISIWVPENGYDFADGDYYELYHNDHTQHPEKKFILDICVPVK